MILSADINLAVVALVVTSLAAAVGVLLALTHLLGRRPYRWLAALHGLPALVGLAAVGLAAASGPASPELWISLGLLALAAAVGVAMAVLMRRQTARLPAPAPLVLAHGFAATAAIALLAWVAVTTI